MVGQGISSPRTPLNSQAWKQTASATQEEEEMLTF